MSNLGLQYQWLCLQHAGKNSKWTVWACNKQERAQREQFWVAIARLEMGSLGLYNQKEGSTWTVCAFWVWHKVLMPWYTCFYHAMGFVACLCMWCVTCLCLVMGLLTCLCHNMGPVTWFCFAIGLVTCLCLGMWPVTCLCIVMGLWGL